MPTYAYRCTECGNAFDVQQAFTEDSLTVCPSCGGKLRKLFSAVGVTFNGSGFYRTDSRAGASKSSSVPASSSSSDSGSSSGGSSSSGSKSDSGSSSSSSSGSSGSSSSSSSSAPASSGASSN
ncbi:FmdB family zinc ribbon protein [Plantibacter sp. YIM 135249]|uniref:FmdB family zinc ribbon protein n=1 Tax=Plantibacter sp. YIM 135249 TaxID=3423918 RepID=UPI003D334305